MRRRVRQLSGIVVVAASLSAAVASASVAQTPASDSTQVMVSGTGNFTLAPDRAVVRAGISFGNARAAQASAAMSGAVRAVIDSISALGFARDSIRTLDLRVWPMYDRDGRRVTGYAAAATVEVVLRDFGMIGRVVDAVLAAGATSVEPIGFGSDSTEWGKRRALAAAFDDARAQAQALAVAAGGRLGRLIFVTTQAGCGQMSVSSGQFEVAAQVLRLQPGVAAASITPQDVHVQATVCAKWGLRFGLEH